MLALSVLPALVMLVLFYSLALHMYQTLGGWPTSIGERGFPPHLVLHATTTMYVFVVLICITVFLLPVALLVCAVVRRLRYLLPYFGVYALGCIVCVGLMQLAPTQFLYWWRD
jgi:hypothetical protein